MLWFRHKSHLVRMRKTWWFCLKYQFRTTESPPEIVHPSLKISRFWSAKTWLEMIWLPMKTTQLWLPQKHLEMVWLPLKNTRLRLPHNTPGCGPASGWKTSSFGHHKKRRLVTWLPVINNRSRSLQEHLETVCRPLKNFATKKKKRLGIWQPLWSVITPPRFPPHLLPVSIWCECDIPLVQMSISDSSRFHIIVFWNFHKSDKSKYLMPMPLNILICFIQSQVGATVQQLSKQVYSNRRSMCWFC